MSEINIINANFTNGREIVTRKIFQYDYGQKLKIKGINLPFIFQAHISNQKQNGTAKKVIGENNEISIPDEYLISGQDIYIFIVLHQALDDGETRYLIKIPVVKRSKSSDQQPTPVQQDIIENAIAALNTAIEATEQNVKHYPKIIDNYWYVYNAQSQEYVNTNIHARGAQGQSAYQIAVKNGYQGTEEEWLLSFTRGEDGYTPVRGVDYWTEEDQNEINTYIVNQMPTKISDLQNDANYIDASGAPVQSVNNQTGNIVITAQSIGALTQHQDISGKADKSELSLVATSGNYNDLTNKPTIPTAISDLTDDSGHYTKPVNGIPASDLADGIIPENFSDRITKGTGEASVIIGDIENNAASENYSYAEGFNTTASGIYSHAEGYGSEASQETAHAEGSFTQASGYYAHAEGGSTTASGDSSHAEGSSTTASGTASHAEGAETTASGELSHAEGNNTTASGENSHAEGYYTLASGDNSHAEGNSTIANHANQHAFGTYNIADSSNASAWERGNYIELVGNGTGANDRSNARTLDWNGNETLTGKLTIGSNPTNNMDVTTKQYVDNSISNVSNTIPTNVSDLTNDSNFTTKNYVDGEISNLQTAIPTNLINGSTNGSLHSINTTTEDANYTMGTDALAIGKNTKAMGLCSVAGGFATQTDSAASGAHAEGLYTHAEKAGAHSEGIRTYATGIYSHAEGTETKAWADSSHSEGKQTNARGPYSHSEGLGTTALNRSQHVFGEYNNLDDGDASVTSDRGRYIEIVGNGTDAQSLSNARTLDWSGNEILTGKLTVGANPVNNMDVTTKQYVDGEIDNLQTTIINVSGTTPTITAETNTMYVCGEVTSLSFIPCSSGICDVRFTSGSTVTVLTIPNTVKFPNSFDPISLETNKIYEINILDGIYGVVTSWEI